MRRYKTREELRLRKLAREKRLVEEVCDAGG